MAFPDTNPGYFEPAVAVSINGECRSTFDLLRPSVLDEISVCMYEMMLSERIRAIRRIFIGLAYIAPRRRQVDTTVPTDVDTEQKSMAGRSSRSITSSITAYERVDHNAFRSLQMSVIGETLPESIDCPLDRRSASINISRHDLPATAQVVNLRSMARDMRSSELVRPGSIVACPRSCPGIVAIPPHVPYWDHLDKIGKLNSASQLLSSYERVWLGFEHVKE